MPLSKIQLSSSTGRRNLLDNGDMQIFQRATSATNPGGGYDTVDRWRSSQNSSGLGNYNAEKSTDTPVGFGSSYKLTKSGTTTQGDAVAAYIEQYIEGQNLQHLEYGTANAKKLTASFFVKSSVTGTYGVTLKSFTGSTKHNVQTFTINSANTWEYKTVTYNGDTAQSIDNDNTAGFSFLFALGVGANRQTSSTNTWAATDKLSTSSQTQWTETDGATFFLTGVQLEVGETATEFEHLPFSEQLNRCKRHYYQLVHDSAQRFGVDGLYANGTGASLNIMIAHPVTMRAGPTVTPGSSMTGNTISFSNTEDYIFLTTNGHSAGRVTVETSSGTTTVSAEMS